MKSDQELFDELSFYTLAHGDRAFIHQNAVDAFAVQNARETSKPITAVFGLVGLYLYLERGFTGKQVQLFHMKLARRRRTWTRAALPERRGAITVADVVAAAAGEVRDAMIHKWCESVWEACKESCGAVVELVRSELDG